MVVVPMMVMMMMMMMMMVMMMMMMMVMMTMMMIMNVVVVVVVVVSIFLIYIALFPISLFKWFPSEVFTNSWYIHVKRQFCRILAEIGSKLLVSVKIFLTSWASDCQVVG